MRAPQRMAVVKGHAYGNDFLLVPEADLTGVDAAHLARALCARQTGIGADGLIAYVRQPAGMRMRLFNADGSTSEVSGNGVRCLAALAVRDQPDTARVTIDTPAGPKILDLTGRSGSRLTFRASMGSPADIRRLTLDAGGETLNVVALSVGNPQCVVLENTLDEARMRRIGPALEHHAAFPNRTNVSFVHVESKERIRILIWERGVGPTSASGTGACGAAVAAAAHGGAGRDIQVTSPGGTQRVEWRDDGLFLTGWAELLFEGHWLADSA